MKKIEAALLFGDTHAGGLQRIATTLGITRQAVWKWKDPLPQKVEDQLIGAAIRIGILKLDQTQREDTYYL